MGTFNEEVLQMERSDVQFQKFPCQASGRVVPLLKLAGLRVGVLRLLPLSER